MNTKHVQADPTHDELLAVAKQWIEEKGTGDILTPKEVISDPELVRQIRVWWNRAAAEEFRQKAEELRQKKEEEDRMVKKRSAITALRSFGKEKLSTLPIQGDPMEVLTTAVLSGTSAADVVAKKTPELHPLPTLHRRAHEDVRWASGMRGWFILCLKEVRRQLDDERIFESDRKGLRDTLFELQIHLDAINELLVTCHKIPDPQKAPRQSHRVIMGEIAHWCASEYQMFASILTPTKALSRERSKDVEESADAREVRELFLAKNPENIHRFIDINAIVKQVVHRMRKRNFRNIPEAVEDVLIGKIAQIATKYDEVERDAIRMSALACARVLDKTESSVDRMIGEKQEALAKQAAKQRAEAEKRQPPFVPPRSANAERRASLAARNSKVKKDQEKKKKR